MKGSNRFYLNFILNLIGTFFSVMRVRPSLTALRGESHRHFQGVDWYWRPPESGCVWYKSRQLKKTICPPNKGGAQGQRRGRNESAGEQASGGHSRRGSTLPLGRVLPLLHTHVVARLGARQQRWRARILPVLIPSHIMYLSISFRLSTSHKIVN